jgi:hypothetical protein
MRYRMQVLVILIDELETPIVHPAKRLKIKKIIRSGLKRFFNKKSIFIYKKRED